MHDCTTCYFVKLFVKFKIHKNRPKPQHVSQNLFLSNTVSYWLFENTGVSFSLIYIMWQREHKQKKKKICQLLRTEITTPPGNWDFVLTYFFFDWLLCIMWVRSREIKFFSQNSLVGPTGMEEDCLSMSFCMMGHTWYTIIYDVPYAPLARETMYLPEMCFSLTFTTFFLQKKIKTCVFSDHKKFCRHIPFFWHTFAWRYLFFWQTPLWQTCFFDQHSVVDSIFWQTI